MKARQTDTSTKRPKAHKGTGVSSLKGRWWKGLMVGVVTGLLGAILALTPLGNDFEKEVGLTWMFHMRGAVQPPPKVAVVAINERAAHGLGLPRLPRDWPRSIHGRLIERLASLGASAIVFDMDFQRPKSHSDDLRFARDVAAAKRVVLFERLNGMRQPVFDVNGRQTGTIWTEELIPPIPSLAKSAVVLAPFPLPKVQVNVFQFWAFKPSVGDAPTMPVAALQVYARDVYPQWLQILKQAGATGVANLPQRLDETVSADDFGRMMRTVRRMFNTDPALGKKILQILSAERARGLDARDFQLMKVLTALYDGHNNRYLNFYGPPGTIPTIPYNTVIAGSNAGQGKVDLNLAGKVVFVGFSDLYDPGQPDRFYTVFTRDDGVDLSGVEIAATAFANLLTNRTLVPSSAITTFSTLFLLGFILGSGTYLLAAVLAVPLALVLTVLYAVGVQFAFNSANVWLPLATPVLVQLPLALFVGLLGQYLLKRRGVTRLSKAVSYYLPEDVARQLTDTELDPNTLNKVVYGICFATDMSGFTSISQTMDPSRLAVFMNSYFDALASALKRYHVDVTEFHADTIMCAWTAASAETLDRSQAPLAALAMLDAVDQFNAETEGVNLYGRVGMEEGQFYLGHTGGGGRLGYSILGDCANTAARLESLNKHLGTHVLASHAVVGGADNLLLRPVGQFVLVGKAEPISVLEVLGERDKASASVNQLCTRFAEAFNAFQSQQWASAATLFEAILKDYPGDGPSRFYLSRCREYEKQVPEVEDPSVVYMNAK
jgi:adenylate cyclase